MSEDTINLPGFWKARRTPKSPNLLEIVEEVITGNKGMTKLELFVIIKRRKSAVEFEEFQEKLLSLQDGGKIIKCTPSRKEAVGIADGYIIVEMK